MNDLVSIIMPLFNAENYVEEAIKSVINQTYRNWELIIVNDGSTDNSLQIVEKFQNSQIKIFSQENKGQCAANNFGFYQSTGNYLKFFDADDILSENMLDEQVKLLKQNPNDIISAKWGRFYDDNISTFSLSYEECWKTMEPIDWLCTSWYKGTSMMQCALFLIPRATLEKAGLWNENLSVINDLEFFTRVILNSNKVNFSDKSILYYRSGNPLTLSGQKTRKSMDSSFNSINLSTGYLLANSKSALAKQSVANIWQSFIYECYPRFKDLTIKAEMQIKLLTKPDLKYHNSPKALIFQKIFGWKFVKLLRHFYSQLKAR